MLAFLRRGLQAVGEFQSRLILTLFYFLVVPVFAMLARLAGDPLGLREFKSGASSWKARKREAASLLDAQRQY
jgi:hypothetical protein